ncbi:hypothetical protein [Streptomyces albus]|nr:hypothetical protein [Streptomyces albus]UVN56585.1 hypothetical protein NR995_20235 [Streptomyces albus]
MQRLSAKFSLGVGLCVLALMAQPGTAWADGDNSERIGQQFQNGSLTDGEATAAAGASREVAYSGSGAGGDRRGAGGLSVPAAHWSPPPCWYAPMYSPKQLKKKVEDSPYSLTGRQPDNGGIKQEVDTDIRHKYTEGDYKNFNLKKEGEGKFWAAVPNPDEPNAAKRQSCTKLPFWVKNGERPDVENAISPRILSQLAFARVRVPETELELNPAGRQTVNLPTWVWLDADRYRKLSVTASVDLGGGEKIWATTTVTPAALRLSPGTQEATTYPSSGECRAEGGRIGVPYRKGSGKKKPPCGVTYLRAAAEGAGYPLKATLTWKASWEGSDGAGDGSLPDGEYSGTRQVSVQEIQSVN